MRRLWMYCRRFRNQSRWGTERISTGSRLRSGQLPSSQAALRPPGPLRTELEGFPSPSASPSNASLEETRFRNGKTLTMNPVMALGMKENAVRSPCRTTHHTGDAVMEPPACGTGDFCNGTACRVHVVHTRDSEEYGYPETFPACEPLPVLRSRFHRLDRTGWLRL